MSFPCTLIQSQHFSVNCRFRPRRTKTRESFCGSQDPIKQRQGSLSVGVKTPSNREGDFLRKSIQGVLQLQLLPSFHLSQPVGMTLTPSPSTHRAGNQVDLVFTRSCDTSALSVTPLPLSDHHFVAFSLPLKSDQRSTLHPTLGNFPPCSLPSSTLPPILLPPPSQLITLSPTLQRSCRPISLLSLISKTLERAVSTHLCPYISQNNLLDPNQSGFKAAHSMERALLTVTESLCVTRGLSLLSVLILLDLSANIRKWMTANHLKLNLDKTELSRLTYMSPLRTSKSPLPLPHT